MHPTCCDEHLNPLTQRGASSDQYRRKIESLFKNASILAKSSGEIAFSNATSYIGTDNMNGWDGINREKSKMW